MRAAKERVLKKYLGTDKQQQYADPSALYEASKG